MAKERDEITLKSYYPKGKPPYQKLLDMYAKSMYDHSRTKNELHITKQRLFKEVNSIKGKAPLKPIRTNRIPHLLAINVSMIALIPPIDSVSKILSVKIEMIYMILYAMRTKYQVIGLSFWETHVRENRIPTKLSFRKIMAQLCLHGLFQRTDSRYSGKDNHKTARYFITDKGKKLGEDLLFIMTQLHTVGINTPVV